MHKNYFKYLRFTWLDNLMEWRILPFGPRYSPRVVTKILRPVMAFLCSTFKILITIYIDDMLIQASSAHEALKHSQITALVLMVLGWALNWEKSCFVPKQEVVNLGFVLNTKTMTIFYPPDKVLRLHTLCKVAMKSGFITVHNLE